MLSAQKQRDLCAFKLFPFLYFNGNKFRFGNSFYGYTEIGNVFIDACGVKKMLVEYL